MINSKNIFVIFVQNNYIYEINLKLMSYNYPEIYHFK